MKKLKTVKGISDDGVNLSLYVWDSKNKEDIEGMIKEFPTMLKYEDMRNPFQENGFFVTKTKKDWAITINKSGKNDPVLVTLPHEISHMADVIAIIKGKKDVEESSELRAGIVGKYYGAFAEVLREELHG